jgi:aspartate racemase
VSCFGHSLKHSKILGIIGGLGPETTSEFYLNLIKKARKYCKLYPRIIIDSISFPFSLEEEIIVKSKNEHKILPALIDGIKRLNMAGVDFIVIPCNTVHVFIKELRKRSKAPIISIVDATVEYIKNKGYKKVGLLATTKTINNKLYEKPFMKNDIETITPKNQSEVAKIILRIVNGKIYRNDKTKLISIIKELIKNGSEAIVLGCTDLQLILNQNDVNVKLIDTTKILVEATFKELITC